MSENQQIFSKLSKHYDEVNAIFSFGTMTLYRKAAAKKAVPRNSQCRILDVATGTGELAFEMARLSKNAHITATDFNSKMLKIAKQKARKRNLGIRFELGDATHIKYANNYFDVVTSGFAMKNIKNSKRFCKEAHRVLKKGGRFVFLDVAKPDSSIARPFIGAYWAAMSAIAKIAGNDSYVTIIKGINSFDKHKFAQTLKSAGFRDITIKSLALGPAYMITGKK